MEQEKSHFIPMPQDLADVIATIENDVHTAQTVGSCPEYSMFVGSLFKQMSDVQQTILHSAVGISGEAGEILDAVKKVWAYGKPLDVEHLIEELGDIRFYYQAMLNLLAITDKEVQAYNITKLSQRYPDGQYSDAAANARADKQPGSDRKFFGQEAAQQERDAAGAGDEVTGD